MLLQISGFSYSIQFGLSLIVLASFALISLIITFMRFCLHAAASYYILYSYFILSFMLSLDFLELRGCTKMSSRRLW